MKYSIIVQNTDGKSASVSFSTEQTYPLNFTVLNLDFTVQMENAYTLPEYQIHFVPREEIRLHSITVQMTAKENKIGANYPMYLFDNGRTTNAFAIIQKIDSDSTQVIQSRELATLHNDTGDLNLAFTTFDRFYTEFHTSRDGICAVYYLEDKPVYVGEAYVLETLVMDDSLYGLDFFEKYTQLLHDRHNIQPMKPIPAGWSSWSCLYGSVDENAVLTQAKQIAQGWRELGADLIQIDDGWQKEGGFAAYWTNHTERFSHDIPWLAKECEAMGLKLGLWMGPGFVSKSSSRFEELYPYINKVDGALVKHFGSDANPVYGLDIGQEKVIDLLRQMLRRGVEEYHSVYFKLDFIVNLLRRDGNGSTRVEYDSGYAVEVYRRYAQEMRKTVGDDVFLLACGAPIGESVGIFDSIRASADIAWGGGKSRPYTSWEIIRYDAMSAIHRSPFHNKVFINDPDALMVRDFQTEYAEDDVVLTLEEAKMWASVVAMSGGQILINEEIDRLSQERKNIFTNILPVLGQAARPRDFYEYPWCTETYIAADDDTQLCAIYNWDEAPLQKQLRNPLSGPAVLVDCWTHQIIGCLEDTMEFSLPAHSSRAFLIKRIPENGGFLYNDGNFYLGIGARNGRSYYVYSPDTVPAGYEPVDNPYLKNLYVKA